MNAFQFCFKQNILVLYMLSTSSICVHVGLKGIFQMPFMLSERGFLYKNGSLENCLQIQSVMVIRIHAIY